MKTALIGLFAVAMTTSANAAMTDAQVTRAIIQESIASYPGPCACPYNTDRRGHTCGRRSAHSRPGGYSPICYPAEVTPEMVRIYRAQHY